MLTSLLVLLAYLCGSIPTGVLVSRRRGIDVRQAGSGNIGATNVARTVGLGSGLLTLLFDVTKGFLPVVAAQRLGMPEWGAAMVGLAAIAGHLFPIFLGFHGGKGVATTAGAFLVLAPAATGVVIVVFALIVLASGFVSLASILAAAALPLAALVLGYGGVTTLAAVFAAVAIALRHRDNLRRLRRGEEPKFRTSRDSPAA
jgi:glycerol-3-phosphate acyltransferase PlsY